MPDISPVDLPSLLPLLKGEIADVIATPGGIFTPLHMQTRHIQNTRNSEMLLALLAAAVRHIPDTIQVVVIESQPDAAPPQTSTTPRLRR